MLHQSSKQCQLPKGCNKLDPYGIPMFYLVRARLLFFLPHCVVYK